MNEIENIISNYCHATVSRTENQPSYDSHKSSFEEEDLSIEGESHIDTTCFTESSYTEENDNLVGTKMPFLDNVTLQQGKVMNQKYDSPGMLKSTHYTTSRLLGV